MSYTIKINDVQTHSPGCYRWASHWQCAVRRIEELAALAGEMLDVFQETCDCGQCGPCKLADRVERVLDELEED